MCRDCGLKWGSAALVIRLEDCVSWGDRADKPRYKMDIKFMSAMIFTALMKLNYPQYGKLLQNQLYAVLKDTFSSGAFTSFIHNTLASSS